MLRKMIAVAILLGIPFHGCFAASPTKDEIAQTQRVIANMVKESQALRTKYMTTMKKDYSKEQLSTSEAMDAIHKADIAHADALKQAIHKADVAHTKTLKNIIAKWGWPTISVFGKETDANAWLLVQRADYDRDFQEHVLGLLEKAAKNHDTRPRNYAYLWDHVQTLEDEPQRYGTQGYCDKRGKFVLNALEDPLNVDKRRQLFGLKPIKDYVSTIENEYCQSRPSRQASGISPIDLLKKIVDL